MKKRCLHFKSKSPVKENGIFIDNYWITCVDKEEVKSSVLRKGNGVGSLDAGMT